MQHALVSENQIESGAVYPPWETAPLGVVSLLAMLEFSAHEFVEISHRFGLLLGMKKRESVGTDQDAFRQALRDAIQNVFGDLLSKGNNLGLDVTTEQLVEFISEYQGNASEEVKKRNKLNLEAGRLVIGGEMDLSRMTQWVETLYSTMRAELKSIIFRAIPKERIKYCNAKWLKDLPIESKFPTSFRELERAGSCYSYGQGTASVFHSMRALEPALAALASPFPHISTTHENWNSIIEQIEKAVKDIGKQPKSQNKIDDETFFGAATSHLYFVKNAWRNHVAHGRGSYSDDEAEKIINRTAEFITSLCARFQE
jgi:hypothetical protein